ncbi:prolyl oligopeptidase family serine peptidase [Streptomyces sp. CA-251387]|uniref:S9 family peptidase n=1 Tax=Streptomyces sp. CA-251387 TaxID=3240064 RepID=UPI003D8E3B34
MSQKWDPGQQGGFPGQYARTQGFVLGVPSSFTVAPDSGRVVFLRVRSGQDRANLLWVGEPTDDAWTCLRERVAADPVALLEGAVENMPAAERARRERSRERLAGVVEYAVDEAVRSAVFALSGQVFVADLVAGGGRVLPVPQPAVGPLLSPQGDRVAYIVEGAVRVVGVDGSGDRMLTEPDAPDVTWGLAEFVAAEEMGRTRGLWWAPDGSRLLAARVDEARVQRWWISNPADPWKRPREIAFPVAGSANADVTLHVLRLDGSRVKVLWDQVAHPYLARVHWSAAGPPLLLVQARDQRSQLTLAVDPDSGNTTVVHTETDPAWLELFAGVPVWTPDGLLTRISDQGGVRRLVVGDQALTGPELQVRSVLDVAKDDVLITASAGAFVDPEHEIGEVHVYRVTPHGTTRISHDPGVHTATRAGTVTVLVSALPHHSEVRARILQEAVPSEATALAPVIASCAERPMLTARAELTLAGQRQVPCAVMLPTGYTPERGPLPVLMDPYGGGQLQRVVASHNAHLISQWFADQGFAVVVADGRGTPGRSPMWEKSIAFDFAGIPLEDQIHALHALAARYPLDLSRVGIRGWSHGGYLAALAVLRRPEVFHAAIAGAPVTDWKMYDTHCTERYLGHPDEHPHIYTANSLIADAANLRRPLMLIHGLADDNVVAAHTLRLSAALLTSARPHTLVLLPGVTHMTPQPHITKNLLLLQADFLKRSLGAHSA